MTDIALHLLDRNIEDEMRASYLDYSMSVIVGRALPNARDGLKPVHRRVLYAMFREGLHHNRRFSKCAGVVGEVLKKYHPHGDQSVYDALARMAQPWNLRYPLVDGQGNFGSVDGDPPAAYRYTECRLTHIAESMLGDIDKETVEFEDNFDGTTVEPLVLPTPFPNLLVNGSEGIAVGMATKIPPHNLGEVIDAVVALIDAPHLTNLDLMEFIPGPDFPTAGTIFGLSGVRDAYETGRGRIIVRGQAEIELDERGDEFAIVITEIPYQVNKARLIEYIADLVRAKKIEGIRDLRDESDRDGMRIVVELKRDAIGQIVLNNLYKQTALQGTFGVINLSIVNGEPRVLSLKETLQQFILHRQEVVTRRSEYELGQAMARIHILEGLLIALDQLDEVIATIRACADGETARIQLISKFGLSELQARAILEMRLQRLTGLEQDKIRAEYAEIKVTIDHLETLLASDELIFALIKEELLEVRETHADERRTRFIEASADVDFEDLIAEEDMAVMLTHHGYMKRSAVAEYRSQRRGGKGLRGIHTKEEDFVENVWVASTHDYLLIFTRKGKMYWLKVYNLPLGGRAARGRPLVNLIPVDPDDSVAAVLRTREFDDERAIVISTRGGMVKRTNLKAYSHVRSIGIIACNLREGDEVLTARMLEQDQEILLCTRDGKAIRFPEDEIREIGRVAAGVKGITLVGDDTVVGMDIIEPGATLLTVSENGFGKRTDESEYRTQHRGGIGLINIKTQGRNGPVVGTVQVEDDTEVMLVTDGGQVIRMPVSGISVIGRNTQGVTLFKLAEREKVVALARVTEPEDGDNGGDAEPDEGDENGEPDEGDGHTDADAGDASPEGDGDGDDESGDAQP
jgi:DNA gyrase subunit A